MGKGGHGGACAGSGHSHDVEYPEDSWNLYQHIERVEALNVTQPQHGGGLFKPHARRLEAQPSVTSDADEEILLKIAFSAPVHIRRIMVIGGGETSGHPTRMQAFVNNEELDFAAAADSAATQAFDLAPNIAGEGFVTTRAGPFTGVTSLALYFT
jgi:hypothetical protein